MSTVSVTNLKNASSSVNNAVTTSGGDLTNAAGVSFMGGSKNLLYNGAMQVAQRGTSVTGITAATDYRTADRWLMGISSLGTWTQDIQNDAPTGSGLRRSLRMLCTTADASPASSDYLCILQRLEGQDVQRIAKGTASAQQLTLSFWVKSNVTGTYTLLLADNDNSRAVGATYTISASATWEKKTVTFPADTTGVFDNDNANSLEVYFNLGGGSGFTGGSLLSSWGAFSFGNNWMPGQVNVAAATNNYWQVTGVQLEVGPVATSFEFKSYGQELRECQRYYYRISPSTAGDTIAPLNVMTTTAARTLTTFPVTMRTAPTALETSSTASNFVVVASNTSTVCSAVPVFNTATPFIAQAGWTVASGLTAGQAGYGRIDSTAAYMAWSAEL